ncbi:MAG: cytidylate kinase-like family protein [Treponema sp.]|nr:cytidylate kinase-like family protein [Treponema sp.]
MGIITVSRELAALGDETAHETAKLLGYRFVEKQALDDRIKTYGVDEQRFKKYDERKPSFLASLSRDKANYLHYLKTALFSEAEQGNCVFIGRGAGAVFKDMPGLVRIFLAAPTEIRIERVKSYFHCDERRARQIIESSDQDRIGFHRYFFDSKWKEPGNYHVVLNTGVFHPATCANIVKQIKEQVITPETEAKNTTRLKELILEQNIKHHIMHEKKIPIHFIETTVTGATITLYGVANSQSYVDAALEAAHIISGSAGTFEVHSEIQIVREYSVIP